MDHESRFLDVTVGWPGSMSPAQVLQASGFFELCQSGQRLGGSWKVPKEENSEELREYIVGGRAYPLLPWLMTPYGGGDAVEAVAELAGRAFGGLKSTWRILDKVMWRPDKHKLPSIILVCCLLHNIMVDLGDKFQEGFRVEDDGGAGEEEDGEIEDRLGGLAAREALLRCMNSPKDAC